MQVKKILMLSPNDSQMHFAEQQTKLQITIVNAEVVAQKTNGNLHWHSDGALDYETCSSLRDAVQAKINKKAKEQAFEQKTKEVTINANDLDIDKYVQALEQEKLTEQREREAEERRDFAKKQARELLKAEFDELGEKIDRLNEQLNKKDNRISKLAGYLEALIKVSGEHELEVAGLIKKRVGYGDEEQVTIEQQEALETAGLDC